MKKTFLALGLAGILMYSVPAMPVKAVSNISIQTFSTESSARTEGLIRKYSLSVSSSGKTLYINGSTASNNSMKSIGYKNVSVEYSSNGVKWYTEKSIGDLLKSDSLSYYLNNYAVSVKGGYYYRVSCTHYAKEKGLFGSSQSVDNTSNSVWID